MSEIKRISAIFRPSYRRGQCRSRLSRWRLVRKRRDRVGIWIIFFDGAAGSGEVARRVVRLAVSLIAVVAREVLIIITRIGGAVGVVPDHIIGSFCRHVGQAVFGST